MILRAQAVKCSLFGVGPLKSNRFKYPKGNFSIFRNRYAGVHAVAIFSELKAGTVGFNDYLQGESQTKEQFALVTL